MSTDLPPEFDADFFDRMKAELAAMPEQPIEIIAHDGADVLARTVA